MTTELLEVAMPSVAFQTSRYGFGLGGPPSGPPKVAMPSVAFRTSREMEFEFGAWGSFEVAMPSVAFRTSRHRHQHRLGVQRRREVAMPSVAFRTSRSERG